MAFYHETFGNVDVEPTSVIGNHERPCGSPARHATSVIHLSDVVAGDVPKGMKRYERGEFIAGISQEMPQSKIKTQEAPVVKAKPRTLNQTR